MGRGWRANEVAQLYMRMINYGECSEEGAFKLVQTLESLTII